MSRPVNYETDEPDYMTALRRVNLLRERQALLQTKIRHGERRIERLSLKALRKLDG